MKRRTLVALGVAAVLAACTGAAESADGGVASGSVQAFGLTADRARIGRELRVLTWPEYIDPALVTEFERTYDVTVVLDVYDAVETMLSKVEAASERQYDLVITTDYGIEQMIRKELLDTLDHSHLPNLGNLADRFRTLYLDPGNRYVVTYLWGTTGLGIRADLVGTDVDSLATWRTVFRGRNAVRPMVMLDEERETIGAALLYLGYSVNSTSKAELDRAADLLLEQQPFLLSYVNYTYGRELLATGDVAVSHNYSGDVMAMVKRSPNIRYVIPREGAVMWTDNMAIPAGAPNKYAAELFINFLLDAEKGAQLANWAHYATPNQAAEPHLDPALLSDKALYPDSTVARKLEFLRDLGPAQPLYDAVWARVKGGF
jgi:spermidine/putrescine transport system substrate-binding protein